MISEDTAITESYKIFLDLPLISTLAPLRSIGHIIEVVEVHTRILKVQVRLTLHDLGMHLEIVSRF